MEDKKTQKKKQTSTTSKQNSIKKQKNTEKKTKNIKTKPKNQTQNIKTKTQNTKTTAKKIKTKPKNIKKKTNNSKKSLKPKLFIIKGFTLVELLAVIAIIGAIGGIVTTAVISTVNHSREKSTTIAMNNVKSAAELYSKEQTQEIRWIPNYDQNGNETGKYVCMTVQQLINNGYFKKSFFNKNIYHDRLNSATYIEIEQGINADNIKVDIKENAKSESDCYISAVNGKLYDINIDQLNYYTDRIEFNIKPKDPSETGAVDYSCYNLTDPSKPTNMNNNKCSLQDLQDDTNYRIKVCMNPKSGNTILDKEVCNVFSQRTDMFRDPTITITSKDNEVNGWSKSKYATIKYNDDGIYSKKGNHYFKSEVNASITEGTVYTCKNYTDTNNSCSTTTTQTIEPNVWYKTPNSTIKLIVTSNLNLGIQKIITARIQDQTNHNYLTVTKKIDKIDTVRPICTSQGGNTTGKWLNKELTLTGKCTDEKGSGCKLDVVTKSVSNSNVDTSPGEVCDNVGNCTTCPAQKTQVDTLTPDCQSSGGNTTGTWVNKKLTLKGVCQEIGNGSGCVAPSVTKTVENSKIDTSPGEVCDNAGNCKVCPVQKTQVDTLTPDCISSGGNTTGSWVNKNLTLKGECKEKGDGSGCKLDVVTKSVSNSNVDTSPGEVCDNANNCTICPAQKTQVDTLTPDCQSSGGNTTGTWVNKKLTLKGVCQEIGDGSGCVAPSVTNIVENSKVDTSPGKVCDKAGNCKICPVQKTQVDTLTPDCISSGGNTTGTWVNKNLTLKGECKEKGDGSGCKVGLVTKSVSNSKVDTSPGEVCDNANNCTICPAQKTQVDTLTPNCTSSGGNTTGTWVNKKLTLKGVCQEIGDGSGCVEPNPTKIVENSKKDTSPGDVCDKAGNCKACPVQKTQVDTIKPDCISSGGNTTGKWLKQSLTLKGECKEIGDGSGCKLNIVTTTVFNSKTDTSPGTVCDNAGNCNACPAQKTQVDTTTPDCISSGGNTTGKWLRQALTLKGECKEIGDGSGCVKPSVTEIVENSKTDTSPGTVCDNAGNCKACPVQKTQVDTIKPDCISSGGNSTGNWVNKKLTLKGECKEIGDGSGCVKSSVTATVENSKDDTSPGTVCDNAGNCNACPAQKTQVDTIAPTCTPSGGNTTWINKATYDKNYSSGVPIKGICYDSLSGCTGDAEQKITIDANGTYSPGTVFDKAGNKTQCGNVNVKIDISPPTCTPKSTASGWTNQKVTITGECSDTGGSGCTGNATKDINEETNTNYSPGTVEDNAGNKTQCGNVSVKIDRTAPTVEFFAYEKNSYFLVSTSDSGSGINASTAKWTGGVTVNKSNKDMADATGSGTDVTYTVSDNAGNQKSVTHSTYKKCTDTFSNETLDDLEKKDPQNATVKVYYWGGRSGNCGSKNVNYNNFKEYGCRCELDSYFGTACGSNKQWFCDTHTNNQATIHYDSKDACKASPKKTNHIDHICNNGKFDGSDYFHGVYWYNKGNSNATNIPPDGKWTIKNDNKTIYYDADNVESICKTACAIKYGT